MIRPEFTLPTYQEFLFTLQEQFTSINYAKVTLKMRSANSGLLLASIFFDLDIRLEVLEDLDFSADHPIRKYSYEVWRGEERLYINEIEETLLGVESPQANPPR